MLLKARRARQTSYGMGVSGIFSSFISYHVLMPRTNSTPVALQYEKFHIPDALRVFDAIVETLSY